jgi:hypothetical protein
MCVYMYVYIYVCVRVHACVCVCAPVMRATGFLSVAGVHRKSVKSSEPDSSTSDADWPRTAWYRASAAAWAGPHESHTQRERVCVCVRERERPVDASVKAPAFGVRGHAGADLGRDRPVRGRGGRERPIAGHSPY